MIGFWPLLDALIQLGFAHLDTRQMTSPRIFIERRICNHDLFNLFEHCLDGLGHNFRRSVGCNQLVNFILAAFDKVQTHFGANLRRTQRDAGFFNENFHRVERHAWQRVCGNSAGHAEDHNQEDGGNGSADAQNRYGQPTSGTRYRLRRHNLGVDQTPDSVQRLGRGI